MSAEPSPQHVHQLQREAVLRRAAGYSWHHHLAVPDQPVQAILPASRRWGFGAPSELKGRFLVLQDASYVISGLLAGPKTVVFYGHRHIDRLYSVSNHIEAVSAPSSTLGDEHGEHGASIVSDALFLPDAAGERVAAQPLRAPTRLDLDEIGTAAAAPAASTSSTARPSAPRGRRGARLTCTCTCAY